MERAFGCYHNMATRQYDVYDFRGVDPGKEAPKIASLDHEAVAAIVEAAGQERSLERLVTSSFDKELMRRHLDIIDTLIAKPAPVPYFDPKPRG